MKWYFVLLLSTSLSGVLSGRGALLVHGYPNRLYVCRNGGQGELRLPVRPSIYSRIMLNDSSTIVIGEPFAKPPRLYRISLEGKPLHTGPMEQKRVRHNRIVVPVRYIPSLSSVFYTGLDMYSTTPFLFSGGRRRDLPRLARFSGKVFNFSATANGRALFVHNPGLHPRNERGRASGKYGDVFRGTLHTLYYLPTLLGNPVKLLSRKGIFRTAFTDSGNRIVFLSAGTYSGGMKGYTLEAVDPAARSVRKLVTFRVPFRDSRGRYVLGSPRVHVFLSVPWAALELSSKKLLLVNTLTGARKNYSVPSGWTLVNPFATRYVQPSSAMTPFFPYIILSKWRARGRYTLRVVRIPDLTTVARHEFKGQMVLGAAWLPGLDPAKPRYVTPVTFPSTGDGDSGGGSNDGSDNGGSGTGDDSGQGMGDGGDEG